MSPEKCLTIRKAHTFTLYHTSKSRARECRINRISLFRRNNQLQNLNRIACYVRINARFQNRVVFREKQMWDSKEYSPLLPSSKIIRCVISINTKKLLQKSRRSTEVNFNVLRVLHLRHLRAVCYSGPYLSRSLDPKLGWDGFGCLRTRLALLSWCLCCF